MYMYMLLMYDNYRFDVQNDMYMYMYMSCSGFMYDNYRFDVQNDMYMYMYM